MELPSHVLSDMEIDAIVKRLEIPNYLGTIMADEVDGFKPDNDVCAVINLEPKSMQGSHWTAFATIGPKSYYFDSYATSPPQNLIKYLKTSNDYENNNPTIYCNALVVQHPENSNCGALSIFVLYYLTRGIDYDHILKYLRHHRLNPTLWITKNHLPKNGKFN